MRVLATMFHPRGLWPFSGSERRFCALSREWAAVGTETWALEPEPVSADALEAGYHAIRVPVRGTLLPEQLLSWFAGAMAHGLDAASEGAFDLVYATNNNVFNLLVAATLSRRLHIPCVAVVHHLRWVYYEPNWTAQDHSRLRALDFVRALGHESLSMGSTLARLAGAELEALLLPSFDGLVTVSQAVRDQLVAQFGAERVYTTGNAFDDLDGPSPETMVRSKAALYVGRLDEGKGALDLARLWTRVLLDSPDARLDIVGDGSLLPRVSDIVSRPPLSGHVKLHGFLGDSEAAQLLNESRLFVTLSRTEGFGLALAEAMAAGLPVVGWATPPLQEIWGSSPAVNLCPPGDLDAAARAVVRILNLPEEGWRELSAAAPAYARRFSWREVAARELTALRDVTGRP